jgi:hypothetical protein
MERFAHTVFDERVDGAFQAWLAGLGNKEGNLPFISKASMNLL